MTTQIVSVDATTSKLQVGAVDAFQFQANGVMSGFTSINGGQLAGLRNRIINGDMRVAQRGTVTFTSTNNLYGGADRWLSSVSGTTVSALALNTPVAGNASSGWAHQIGNVTTTGATTVALSQRIESLNSASLNSKTVTVSGKLYQSTGSTQTCTVALIKANAVDNFGTTTTLATQGVSVANATYVPFTFTTAVAATDASNGLQLTMAYNSLGAQTNAQFLFADIQLEVGSTATTFEQRPYGMELALCQRYYEALNLGMDYSNALAAVYIIRAYKWAVTKRVSATVTYAASPQYVNSAGTNVGFTPTIADANPDMVRFGATGLTNAAGIAGGIVYGNAEL